MSQDIIKDDEEQLDKDETIIDEELNVDSKDEFDYELNEDDFMLSTIDNPYSPKTDYYMWKRYDSENGYNTEEYIARLLHMEEDYDSDDEFILNILTTKVINDILENDDLNLYRLV